MRGDELGQRGADTGCGLIVDAEDEYPSVGAWRIGAHVAQTAVQRDQQAFSTGSSTHNLWIGGATQAFVVNGVDVMAGRGQPFTRRPRKVLIQLDPHSPGVPGVSGTSSSRANSAP